MSSRFFVVTSSLVVTSSGLKIRSIDKYSRTAVGVLNGIDLRPVADYDCNGLEGLTLQACEKGKQAATTASNWASN